MTENRRGMLPADLFRLKLVSDAQISPDGARVAFVVTRLDEEQDEYLSTIWMVAAGGGEPRQFTYGVKRDTAPRWSPDGRMLAFLSEREGKKPQVYVMPSDGGEPHRLTDLALGCDEPVWSPDGTRIAFTARVAPEEPDEKDKEKSKPARVITSLRYKANDGGFVYDKRRHVFVVPVDGGEAKQVTDGGWDDGTPTWSPDGTQLAFASSRHDDRDYDLVSDIWVLPAGGGIARQVTPGRGPSGAPAWSRDGRLIAYTGNE
jgi:Tol biopolymer transport system component